MTEQDREIQELRRKVEALIGENEILNSENVDLKVKLEAVENARIELQIKSSRDQSLINYLKTDRQVLKDKCKRLFRYLTVCRNMLCANCGRFKEDGACVKCYWDDDWEEDLKPHD